MTSDQTISQIHTDAIYSSKSERKAAVEELYYFAKELIEMVPTRFAKLEVSDQLRKAVVDGRPGRRNNG